MANYVLLERIELNASAASVTFSNIPQSGYTDLKIVVSGRIDVAAVDAHMYLTFNNNSSNAYSFKFLRGTGAAASSYSETNETSLNLYATVDGNSATSNTFSNTEIYIPNYTGSNYKSLSVDAVQENNATTAYQHFYAGIWNNTAAITSVKLTGSASWMQYSTFSLYGLAAVGSVPAIAPKASGGNIQTDGTYWYHSFLSTGAFVPSQALSCDYLVVAGGGGGGYDGGGGGGAGGFRAFTSQSLSAASYAVTIGAGGAAAANVSVQGSTGGVSTFNSNSSSGGGGGGSDSNASGASGGSGGGGRLNRSLNAGGSGNSGGYSPVEGYAGASGTNSAPLASGGGGGAGAVGDSNASRGGNGSSAYSSWGLATGTGQNVSGTYYYAGGGGGNYAAGGSTPGLGGYGGGGNGSSGSNVGPYATYGTTNTGGGGGGGSGQNATYFQGGSGGSGIVIIRYAI